jgi:hypothetical protein
MLAGKDWKDFQSCCTSFSCRDLTEFFVCLADKAEQQGFKILSGIYDVRRCFVSFRWCSPGNPLFIREHVVLKVNVLRDSQTLEISFIF